MPLRLSLRTALAALAATTAAVSIAVAAQAAPPAALPQPVAALRTAAAVQALTTAPAPRILGSATPGAALRVAVGAWRPAPVQLRVRWLRDGRPIAGAVHRTYVVRAADRGAALSVVVRGTKDGYRAAARRSAAVRVPLKRPSAPPSAAVRPPAAPTRATTPAPVAAPVGSASAAPASVPPAPTATATPADGIAIRGDGDLRVGTDVQPGLYVTSGPTTSCIWKTVSSFDRAADSVNHRDYGAGTRVLQVRPTDFGVSLSGCGTWFRAADVAPESAVGYGVHVVGRQVPPGAYRASVPADGCYWALLSAFDDSAASIIRDGYSSPGASTVTVTVPADAAGFKTSSCGPWTRVG